MAIPYNRFAPEIKGRNYSVTRRDEDGFLIYSLEYEVVVDGVKQIRTSSTGHAPGSVDGVTIAEELAAQIETDTGITMPTS